MLSELNNNATLGNLNKALESAGIKAEFEANNKDLVFSATKNGAGLTLQIGDTSADFNQMTVSVSDMHTTLLELLILTSAHRLERKQQLTRSNLQSTPYLLPW